jgi:hypothetical protein
MRLERVIRTNPRRRRFAGKILVVSVVAAVALGWLTWTAWAGAVAEDVSASWRLHRCEGTTVGRYQGAPAIRSRADWSCGVRLNIVNRSGRAVQVAGVEGPLMGTEGGAEVQGMSSPVAPIRDANANADGHSEFGDVDAVWHVTETIAARSSLTLDLTIGWRQSGCNSAGYLHIDRWPTILIEALGRPYRYSPQQRLVLRTYDDPHDAKACPR